MAVRERRGAPVRLVRSADSTFTAGKGQSHLCDSVQAVTGTLLQLRAVNSQSVGAEAGGLRPGEPLGRVAWEAAQVLTVSSLQALSLIGG